MAQTEGEGGRRIEEAQGKTGQAQGDQGWTRKEIGSTKEGIFFQIVKPQCLRLKIQMSMGLSCNHPKVNEKINDFKKISKRFHQGSNQDDAGRTIESCDLK